MQVSIPLTAATACTVHACPKCLDETQWSETRDKIYWAETETYCPETETLRILSETRLRHLDQDHIPGTHI